MCRKSIRWRSCQLVTILLQTFLVTLRTSLTCQDVANKSAQQVVVMEFGKQPDITDFLPTPTCYGFAAGKLQYLETGVTDFGLNEADG